MINVGERERESHDDDRDAIKCRNVALIMLHKGIDAIYIYITSNSYLMRIFCHNSSTFLALILMPDETC